MADDKHEVGKVDRRQVERWYPVFYLRVFDGTSPEILGHLVNISEKGMMLICDNPVEVNKKYRLRMHLPNQMKDQDQILFSATSSWCKKDVNPDFYLVGFAIYDLQAPVRELVATLIRDFSRKENQ